MQDEVNEKTIALYIKTGKLTAQTLQKAMKAILSKGKKQLAKPPQGKQSLKQLMKQNAGVSNIEITEGNNGNCILLDDGDECVCPQLISYSLLCKWFRVAVLPADRLLYAELYQTGDKKKCTECGAFFASTSNSVKYCPVCRKRITRRQAAERMRKRRAPVTQ